MSKHLLASNPLGKTGITVTRLSAGGHFTLGPSCHHDHQRRIRELHHMLDSGITYFDVQWEPEELAMAEVMRDRRSEFAVAWPLHGVTERGANLTADYILDYCADHRRRFGIDHVEVLLWIALEMLPGDEERMMEQVRKASAVLKADGFIDHFGFSCHYSPAMAQGVIERFPDDFGVVMVPYCPLHPAAGRSLFQAARARGIGTVGMKPFGGGKGFHGMVWSGEVDLPATAAWKGSARPYQAALKWVLQNPDMDCTVPGMHSVQQIDELLAVAGRKPDAEDAAVLAALQAALDASKAPVQLHWENICDQRAWD